MFGPFVVSFLVAALQDLKAYLRCRKYKKQGFLSRYRFMLGTSDLLLPDASKVPDIMTRYKKVLHEVKEQPGLVVNSNPRGRAAVYLTDPSVVHEFFLKEVHFTRKHEFSSRVQHYNDYFPFMRGPVAEAERQAFKDFFSRSHLAEILGFLRQHITHHIGSVESSAKETGNWENGVFTADWKQPNYHLLFQVATPSSSASRMSL